MKDPPGQPKAKDHTLTMPYLGEHGLLLFGVPDDAEDGKIKLAAKIGRLDKKAYRELGYGSNEWNDVLRLLASAISMGIEGNSLDQSEVMVSEAELLLDYYRELLPRNRAWYLVGTVIGVGIVALLGLVLGQLLALVTEVSWLLILAVCALAALGGVASVLSRLTSIDSLAREHSLSTVVISGAIQPIVAALIAVAVFLVLQSGLVTVTVGTAAATNSPELKLVVAFLCGFSERFGPDILAKIKPKGNEEANTE
jgi:hypothetical protein